MSCTVKDCRYSPVTFGGKCGFHTDLDQAPDVMTEVLWLLGWVRNDFPSGTGVGDNGERPSVTLSFDGEWDVTADDFYAGHAHVYGKQTLLEAAREARARLTEHPEREKEQVMNRLALDIAAHTSLDKDQAVALLLEHWDNT